MWTRPALNIPMRDEEEEVSRSKKTALSIGGRTLSLATVSISLPCRRKHSNVFLIAEDSPGIAMIRCTGNQGCAPIMGFNICNFTMEMC